MIPTVVYILVVYSIASCILHIDLASASEHHETPAVTFACYSDLFSIFPAQDFHNELDFNAIQSCQGRASNPRRERFQRVSVTRHTQKTLIPRHWNTR
jgi:hypothetical protein